MGTFLVIAYATKNDYYEELSNNLKNSCISNNIPLHLELIESLGSWENNTHFKASFIKRCIENNKEYTSFVYVDVDAVFRSYPTIFDNMEHDVAFRIENFKWRPNEPLSGTIFFKKSDGVIKLLDDWIEINNQIKAERNNPLTWEQFHLKSALDRNSELSFLNLPPEYCYVDTHSKNLYPLITPIIYHYQASRITCKNK